MEVTERVVRLRQELLGDSLSPDDTAQILGLDRSTIMRYLRDGKIKGYQVGRAWHITEDALRAYVNGLKEASA